jgi:hypothetical protein
MRALPLVAVAGGLTALAKPAAELAASFSAAAREMDKFTEGRVEQLREQIAALEDAIDAEKDALNFRIAATAQLLEGGEQVIAQQQRQVEWAKEQLDVQFSIALRERELAELRGESTKEQEAQIAILRKAIDELRKDSERLNQAQAIVADGFQVKFSSAQSESIFHALLFSFMAKPGETQEMVVERILMPWLKEEEIKPPTTAPQAGPELP